jgi:hypothetical protein
MDGVVVLVVINLGMKRTGMCKTSGNIRGRIVWGRNVRSQNISIVETWLQPWLMVKPVGCTVSPLYSPCMYISCYVCITE